MKKETKKKKNKILKVILICFGFLLGLVVLMEAVIAIRESIVTKDFKEGNKKILGTYSVVNESSDFPETFKITEDNSSPYCMGYEKEIKYYSYTENNKVYIVYYLNGEEYLFELKNDILSSPKTLKTDFDCITFGIHVDNMHVSNVEYQKNK